MAVGPKAQTPQEKLAAAQRHWLDNQDDPKAMKALRDAEDRVAKATATDDDQTSTPPTT